MPIPFQRAVGITASHVERGKQERIDWDRWHSWYLSEYWDAENGGSVQESLGSEDISLETNYPYAFVDTMIANVCPTNPMITVNARRKELHDTARAREDLVNDSLRRDKMHAKSWDMATFSAICGRAVSKTVFNKRTRRPTTRIVNPRNFFYDMSTDWEDVRYAVEAIQLTEDEFKERIKNGSYSKKASKAVAYGEVPEWMFNKNASSAFYNEASQEAFKWAVVYEFYDFTADKFYHFLEGSSVPLYEGPPPYKYNRNPFSLLMFNKSLRENSGISDVKLIARIQERLNEIDTLELLFAHTCIPVTMMNEAHMDDPEAARAALRNATRPGDIAGIKASQPMPFEQLVTWTKTPTMSPSWDKMRERCTALIEFILGIPQYSRGAYGGAEVATELALVDTATRTRNGRRIKVIEDWIVEVSKKSLGLWKEYLSPEETLSLRNRSSFESSLVGRAELAFPNPDERGNLPADDFEDEWCYDFEAVPYSPTENHRLVQLQKLQQFMQFLVGNAAVDQGALITKLTELLGMDELRQPPGATAPGVMPAPAPPNGTTTPMPDGSAASGMVSGGAQSAAPQQAAAPIMPVNAASGASVPGAA
jgi:hypothetical protein